MCSGSGKSTSNIWRSTEGIKLAPNFKVEWITYASLSINRLGNTTNPLNNNESIKKSRDTQELPPELGKDICRMFEIPLKEEKVLESDGEQDGKSEEMLMIDPSEFWNTKRQGSNDEGARRPEKEGRGRLNSAKKQRTSGPTGAKEERGGPRSRKGSINERKADESVPLASRVVLARKKSSTEVFKPTGHKEKPQPERRRSKERKPSNGHGRKRSRSKSKERVRDRSRDRDREKDREKRSRSRDKHRSDKDRLSSRHKHRRD